MATRIAVSLLTAALLIVASAPQPARASHPVPTPEVVQTGLVIPWDVDFAPDGTMFVTERPGRIRVYASGEPGAALVSTTTVPNVRAEHESGVNGIAVDNDFASNRFIYVCAARDTDGAGGASPWVNELIRYRVTPQRTLTDPNVLLTGAAAATRHNGCSVEMDATDHLWIGIGDGAVASRAQDPDSLNGKILRIERDGSIPADNPRLPGSAAVTAVYSMGHRNPQGIAFAPGTGQPYAAEHGPDVNDEINRLEAGANYGWPCYTGDGKPYLTAGCGPASAYDAPAWASGSATIATSGMTFLNHPSWAEWNGSAMVAQLKEQDLRRFTLSTDGNTLTQADLALDGDFGRLRAAVMASDGSLYLTTSNGTNDKVLRVRPGDVPVDRYAGTSRYDTAVTISRETFQPGVPVVYIAAGTNYPDALSGGAAAAHHHAPILLVEPTRIPAVVKTELTRLKPLRIVVLGGTIAVSASVEAQLEPYAPGGASRLSGRDRYATAAAISRATFGSPARVAYVATGQNFPDALAGVPAAGLEGGPILLVQSTAIPAATRTELDRLNPARIVLLGGTGAISGAVSAQLQAYTPTGIVRRSGGNRYETAVNISQRTFPARVAHVFVATGEAFPDGLSGGPAAALERSPLLLVPSASVPASVRTELLRLDPNRVTILGGENAVSDLVRDQIDALLNP